MSNAEHNASAWGLPNVLDFFETERTTTAQVYPSEWFFLKDRLKDGISLLDVGCAQGGFAGIMAENLKDFRYTGIDISADMIERAKAKHPDQEFHHVPEGDDSVLDDRRFDIVLVLGILHLHETWRETIADAWKRTAGCLILDLREHGGKTLEDKAISSFAMDFHGGDDRHSTTLLPYNVINSAEALTTLGEICGDASRISHYGYLHPVSGAARCPVPRVMCNTWCLER